MFFLFWTIEEEKIRIPEGRNARKERCSKKRAARYNSPGSFLECDERRRRIAKLASREG